MISCFLARKAKRGHSALWLGVFLLAQVMVVFPGLHHLVHSDSSRPDHECAITLLAHGQVNSSETTVPLVRPDSVTVLTQSLPQAAFVSTDVRLLPGRGPPSPQSLHS